MATVEEKIKNRLGIKPSVTMYDALIDDFIDSSVGRLFPAAGLEIKRQTVPAANEIDLSQLTEPMHFVRRVEWFDQFSGKDRITREFYHHGDYLYMKDLPEGASDLVLYGVAPFETVDDVPIYLLQVVIWFSMAEFYDYLAGDKSRYNIYMEATGARGVDNMQDLSAYYETKGTQRLEEAAQVYAT